MGKWYWTKEKIIAELKRTQNNGPKRDQKIVEAAQRHFGSLRAALEEAGLPSSRPMPPYRRWSRESVIAAICEWSREGKCLDAIRRQNPSLQSAARGMFGTWRAAREAAGFPKREPEWYAPDEVCLRIIDLYERELPLAFKSHNDETLRRSAIKHFGSWRRAAESLGLGSEVRRRWTKETVIKAILHRRASNTLHQTKTEDKGLFAAAISRFGTWQIALEAAGIDGRVLKTWNREKIIESLQQHAKTPSGHGISKFDPHLASAAVRHFGSLYNALEAAGTESLSRLWTKKRIISAIQSSYSAKARIHLAGFGDPRLADTARRHFGSWEDAIEAAGLTDRVTFRNYRKWAREDVLAEIGQRVEAGESLSCTREENQRLAGAARRHFGSWSAALLEAGVTPKPGRPSKQR